MLRPRSRAALACLLLPLAGCDDASPEAAAAPRFAVQDFFRGETRGEGSLDTLFSSPVPLSVESHGHVEADGTLVLEQRIATGGEAPRRRTWRLRPSGEDRFTGSLTDAEGPVDARVSGNRLAIAYRDRDGYAIRQWLTLRPGGRVADNRLTARRFGIAVARVDETIRKID